MSTELSRGFTEDVHWDVDGNMIIKRTADLSGHLDTCRELRAETNSTRKYGDGMLHFAASIPAIVVFEWIREGIDFFNPSPDDTRRIKEKLNGSHAYLKVRDARL